MSAMSSIEGIKAEDEKIKALEKGVDQLSKENSIVTNSLNTFTRLVHQ